MISKYVLVLAGHLLNTSVLVKFINYVLPAFAEWTCSFVSTYVLWICIAWFSFSFTRDKFLRDEIDTNNRAVFITGCDSGFGNALARRLDAKGFQVFATCLFPEGTGTTELKESCSSRLHVLHMDVTKDESVKEAFEYVNGNLGSSDLWAVVNNAGILKGFSVEFSSLDDFRDCLDVNLMGYVRVTKAFLPLLKKSKGRIVNVTSGAGEMALPFFTPYTTSKFAAVGFTDCLRFEIDTWGVSVVSIEPELFLTGLTRPDIVHKSLDDKFEGLGSSNTEYGEDYASSFRDIERFFLSFACPKVSIVVDDLESAVSVRHPYHTYKPRRHFLARSICFFYEAVPRSCQIILMKLALAIFFSKTKVFKNLVLKIAAYAFFKK